jgi:hypothetical protein
MSRLPSCAGQSVKPMSGFRTWRASCVPPGPSARPQHLSAHQALLRRRYSKFRHALQEAVEQQTAVIKERQAAVAELGEHAVQLHLPNLCYADFLFGDLFALWTAEQDGVFAEPLPKPAVVAPRPAPAPAPAKPAEPDFGWGWTRRQPGDEPVAASDPPPRPKRVPRRDAPPADGSQRQVVLLRTGLELPDGGHAPARAASSMRLAPVHRHRRGYRGFFNRPIGPSYRPAGFV